MHASTKWNKDRQCVRACRPHQNLLLLLLSLIGCSNYPLAVFHVLLVPLAIAHSLGVAGGPATSIVDFVHPADEARRMQPPPTPAETNSFLHSHACYLLLIIKDNQYYTFAGENTSDLFFQQSLLINDLR
jgi:hypothetical protein